MHGGATRLSDGVSTLTARASAKDFFSTSSSARTVSPGTPPRTKTTRPSWRATMRPPYAPLCTTSSMGCPACVRSPGERRYLLCALVSFTPVMVPQADLAQDADGGVDHRGVEPRAGGRAQPCGDRGACRAAGVRVGEHVVRMGDG